MEAPEQFEGWAIVELFGHQREIGYVTTRYFGTACMFQVDAPELPERDYILSEPQYCGGVWTPAGAKVRKKSSAARSRLLGPGSIYALNPCSEEAAKAAIERLSGREIVVIELPKEIRPLLPGERVCGECGAAPEEEHEIGCSMEDVDDDEAPLPPGERACGECGAAPEEEHEIGCSMEDVDDDEEMAAGA